MVPLIVPFMLVLARLVGLFVFAPVISSTSVPLRARALLAFVMTLTLMPVVPRSAEAQLDIVAIVPAIVAETMVGMTIGLLASIPLFAMEMAGTIMGHQMGLGLARSYNPELDTDADSIGQMLFALAGAAMVAMGGVEALFLALARSFERVPAGSFASMDIPIDLYMGMFRSGVELAIRVAAPVIGMLMLILLALGFIMKTMPQINILSVGFALKIVAGITIILWSIGVIGDVAGQDIGQALRNVISWAESGHGTGE